MYENFEDQSNMEITSSDNKERKSLNLSVRVSRK